jgi:hypothetical protein
LAKPRKNIILRVCAGYNNPWPVGSPANGDFRAQLETWSNLTERVYIWDYKSDFEDLGWYTPYPVWNVMQANMQQLMSRNVKGYYAEADITNLYGTCKSSIRT